MASLRAFLGIYPKTSEYEAKRQKLEEEYKAILDFESSEELKRHNELDHYIRSNEFAQKKKDILTLKFRNTEDYHKEMEFEMLSKTKAISLFYKVKESPLLNEFYETEKSKELKNYLKLEELIKSTEFAEIKKKVSLPPKKKFAMSDLGKTLHQYKLQKKAVNIRGYYKFITDKAFRDFESAIKSDLPKKVAALEKKISLKTFQEKKALMKKHEFKNSQEKELLHEYRGLIKSKVYKNFQNMAKSPFKKYYDELHDTAELEAFENLKKFIGSNDFIRQKKEIESFSFKDTPEYKKLLEYENLKKSARIRNYLKFKDSKEFLNYQGLDGSVRISEYEKLRAFIRSDKFVQKKAYYSQFPKKRWKESGEYKNVAELELLQKSDKFKWYFKNKAATRFSWLRVWHESFVDDFASRKLDPKKWITRYFYGEALLKDSYSLSHDKHFVTDGQNLDFTDSSIRIVTKKETITGKSWNPSYGFITREFGYTSGLINTGKSFRQKYGTFEAKIKFHNSRLIQNAFWMVSNTMLPHIDIAKANKRIVLGNAWGDPKNLKNVHRYSKSVKRSKFASDFHIYTLEWTPTRLIWKINGVEVTYTTHGIPQEAMYIVLSAGLHKDMNEGLPAQMEIDWVKCYQREDY
jgi:beta-glucanase (GH16 family)